MQLSGLGILFWVAGSVGHLVLLAVLLVRRRVAQFPFFTALIAENVLRSATLYLVGRYGGDESYYAAYLVTSWVDITVELLVVYEVAAHVFRPLGSWAPDARRGIHLMAAGSLLLALGLTWLAGPSRQTMAFSVLVKAGFFSSLLMSELFLGLVVLSAMVSLPWRTHVSRIALGLGLYSLFETALDAAHALGGDLAHPQLAINLNHTRNATYIVCLVYWIVTLSRDAPEPRELSPEMRHRLEVLQGRLAYDLDSLRQWRKP